MTPDDVIKEIRVLPGTEEAVVILHSGIRIRVDRHGTTLPGAPQALTSQHIELAHACLDDALSSPAVTLCRQARDASSGAATALRRACCAAALRW